MTIQETVDNLLVRTDISEEKRVLLLKRLVFVDEVEENLSSIEVPFSTTDPTIHKNDPRLDYTDSERLHYDITSLIETGSREYLRKMKLHLDRIVSLYPVQVES